MRPEKNTLRYLLAFVAVVCGLTVLSFLGAAIVVLLKQPIGRTEAVVGLMLLALSVAVLTYQAWNRRFPSISEIRKAAGYE